MCYKILAINPGSTSTKIAIYQNTTEVITENISHSPTELKSFSNIMDQFEYRLEPILSFLEKQQLAIQDFSAIVGRGGLLKPIVSGTYLINEAMLSHLKSGCYGSHASNLGAILANHFSNKANCPGFIVDPVVVDELDPICRLTGRPELPKKSIFHALNHKAVGKRFANSINQPYDKLNLIIAHLGGGISIGCHKQGRVIEVNNALNGEGPFSPERAGTMQAGQFAEFITQRNYNTSEISAMLSGQGGLVAHLGLNDVRQIQDLVVQGNKDAILVYEAMIYNIARYIAAAAVPVCGKVDNIILTGGIAHSTYITNKIIEYIGFIAPVVVIPGENELQALAEGAFRILTGEEKAKIYI